MAERLSKQPFNLQSLNLVEVNDLLRRLQLELDRLAGLHGTVVIYDSLHIEDDNGQVLHAFGARP